MYIIYYSKCSQISPLCSLKDYDHSHIQDTPIIVHTWCLAKQLRIQMMKNTEPGSLGSYKNIAKFLGNQTWHKHTWTSTVPSLVTWGSTLSRLPNSIKLCKNLAPLECLNHQPPIDVISFRVVTIHCTTFELVVNLQSFTSEGSTT
jgi:hypothetical protein